MMYVCITVHFLTEGTEDPTVRATATNMNQAREVCTRICTEGVGFTTADGVYTHYPPHIIAMIECEEVG